MTAPNQAIPQTIYDHDFVRLAKSASHPREKIRFLAFSHLKDGKKPSEVADIVRVARNSLYHWLRRFREKGLEGLREQGGRGKNLLSPKKRSFSLCCFRATSWKRWRKYNGKRCSSLNGREVWDQMLIKKRV
ncbi:MAG: helix-turn-helix domain-containing protein [Chlamydiales bacterium]|nr:helix-turn-helix domain-containing protein [Chlamydiales bacterium]